MKVVKEAASMVQAADKARIFLNFILTTPNINLIKTKPSLDFIRQVYYFKAIKSMIFLNFFKKICVNLILWDDKGRAKGNIMNFQSFL